MFDIGFWELLVIFVLGLLILGPERLPKVVSQLGRWIGKARRTATDLRRQLEREVELEEFAKANRARHRPPERPTPFRSPVEAGNETAAGQDNESLSTAEHDSAHTGDATAPASPPAPPGGPIQPPDTTPSASAPEPPRSSDN